MTPPTHRPMKLQNCRVIGFFSMPSQTFAQSFPESYNMEIRRLVEAYGPNIGSCEHCGIGITHHVVVVDENNQRRLVGTSCATKVGCDPEQIRSHLTDEQKAEREAKADAWKAKFDADVAALTAKQNARREQFADIIAVLMNENSDFHKSLADSLVSGPLTYRQAQFVAKAHFPSRRQNKSNFDKWESIIERVMAR